MKQIETKVVQKMKLDALKILVAYCQSQKINIFMAYGSLIGAAREKGFIPWDEDIDLYMFREDYDKLEKCDSNILGEKYFLQTRYTDKHFYVPMARLCIKGTYRCETGLEGGKFNKGTFIDIFPLDKVPASRESRSKIYKKARFIQSLMRYKVSKNPHKGLKRVALCFLQFVLHITPFCVLQAYANRFIQKHKNIDSNCYMNLVGGQYGVDRETYLREWFDGTEYLPFEDTTAPCPKGYDALLTAVYGDYMKRPAEGNRKIDCPSFYID